MTRHKVWSLVEISAYLDKELDATTLTAFEGALDRDEDLRRQVDDLRATVALVRAAPLREPPRHYLLTRGMVAEAAPKRSKQRRTPLLLMRLATSLTAIAFVVTVGLNFLWRGFSPAMVMQDSAELAITPVSEKAVEAPAMASVPEEALAESAPRAEQVPPPGDVVGTAPEPTLAVGDVEPLMLEAAKVGDEDASSDASSDAPGTGTEEKAPEELRAMMAAEDITETSLSGEAGQGLGAPALSMVEAVTGTFESDGQFVTSAENHDAGEVRQPSRTFAFWLPGALGFVTLILAGITFWMSRRQ